MQWQAAVDYCKNNTTGLPGSGWRLPTRWELQTIVNYGKANPAIDEIIFPYSKSGNYWTSSSSSNGSLASIVSFNLGDINFFEKDFSFMVRCVRSGQINLHQFIDNGNGTITDKGTGIMWQKATSSETYNWEDTLKYCEDMILSGYSDWRLPDIKELFSLVDENKFSLSIDKTFFPDTKNSCYWSSSTSILYSEQAWQVDFGGGNVQDYCYNGNDEYFDKYHKKYVRCVRSGQ
jgi:hypothetical protein